VQIEAAQPVAKRFAINLTEHVIGRIHLPGAHVEGKILDPRAAQGSQFAQIVASLHDGREQCERIHERMMRCERRQCSAQTQAAQRDPGYACFMPQAFDRRADIRDEVVEPIAFVIDAHRIARCKIVEAQDRNVPPGKLLGEIAHGLVSPRLFMSEGIAQHDAVASLTRMKPPETAPEDKRRHASPPLPKLPMQARVLR
jgi:hypothetical protein